MTTVFSHKWLEKYNRSFKRSLLDVSDKIDFASNDYLGFVKEHRIKKIIQTKFEEFFFEGSTGSRLISGHRNLISEIEQKIADLHHAEAALIYASGYQANVGLFSCIADRNDLYLIDESVHASIYDGIRLSFAAHFKFRHNDLEHLKALIEKYYAHFENIYVVVEGLYSMDGDSPNTEALLELIDTKKLFLIVDEAHSFGVMGKDKLGAFNAKGVADKCAARIIGYGKAAGFAGAAVLGSFVLKQFLINHSRSFIFSTALPIYHYQMLSYIYDELVQHSEQSIHQLYSNIHFFLQQTKDLHTFSKNNSPIQYVLIPQDICTEVQQNLLQSDLYAKVILPPTVPSGKERIRISLHAFNTEKEIVQLIQLLKTLVYA